MNPATEANQSGQKQLTHNEIERISALIYQRAGIVLTPQKRDMVYNRLSRRIRVLELKGFTDYINLLVANPESDEWQVFINALTTNLTSFFARRTTFRSWRAMRRPEAVCTTCGVRAPRPVKNRGPSP